MVTIIGISIVETKNSAAGFNEQCFEWSREGMVKLIAKQYPAQQLTEKQIREMIIPITVSAEGDVDIPKSFHPILNTIQGDRLDLYVDAHGISQGNEGAIALGSLSERRLFNPPHCD